MNFWLSSLSVLNSQLLAHSCEPGLVDKSSNFDTTQKVEVD